MYYSISYRLSLCLEHTVSLQTIIDRSFRHCCYACDCIITDLRARDRRKPFVSLSALTRAPELRPRPDRRDTLATDLRLTSDTLRPISDRPTTWARITFVTRQMFAWKKNQEWLATDLRPCRTTRGNRVNYDQPTKTCDQGRIQLRVGSLASEIDKFHGRFWRLKNNRRACRFQWRVGPSYCEYPGITYDLLVSNIGGTYDRADQLPGNREFGHLWS